jgi:hypothetical protein
VTPASPPAHLGFLTVAHEPGGFLGGYLVTNFWGRPLEFRLSTAVQPNRVQQILYGSTLADYVCGELIGKALYDKTGSPAQVILTDTVDAWSLRQVIDVPVIRVAPIGELPAGPDPSAIVVRAAISDRGPLLAHPDFPDDGPRVKDLFDRLAGLDMSEPFARIRDAIAEARKMGVTHRAAG